MQTILGSGGAIGLELAKALRTYTDDIRQVSRNPKKVNPGDKLMAANLLNRDELRKAVEGSSVVYLTIGLPYKRKVWEKEWPRLMSNLIEACIDYKCKLVFFDNIYMYDPDYLDRMKEDTPLRPVSKKGAVRAEVHRMIMEKVSEGRLTALIARSADYYGPSITQTSMLTETIFNPLSQGKKANIMGPMDVPHSFTYTPDAGKATALLGNREDSWQQVWHLPTAGPPLSSREILQLFADEMGIEAKYRQISRRTLQMMGLFLPVMKEVLEVLYQFEKPYFFDSSKIENKYGLKPTPYEAGIRAIIESDYKNS